MSQVNWEKVIRHLSTLALLELDQAKAETLSRDLEKILDMFNKISELGIAEEVEPLYTTFFGEVNLGDDIESESMRTEEIDPAGDRLEGDYFKSPKTL